MAKHVTWFMVGTGSNCSSVGELQHLNLGGQLELHQLENVLEADAEVANLRKLKELRELTLIWTDIYWEEQGRCFKVLQGLEPNDGLQVIKIFYYGDTIFPKWMGMLQNMVEIHLCQCGKLRCLFSRGTTFTFPKLKELTLETLPEFEKWLEINEMQGEHITFPQLEKLFIRYCEKLTTLPAAKLLREPCGADFTMASSAFPALKVLELESLNRFQRWEASEGTQGKYIMFPQLEELSVRHCPELIALPKAPLLGKWCGGDEITGRSAFPALKELQLDCLESFNSWEIMGGTYNEQLTFPNLERVHIKDCPELRTLPEAPKLSVLQINIGKPEMSKWIARYMASLTSLILWLEEPEKNENSLIELVDSVEKYNHKFPLTVLNLFQCNIFFHAGALVLWTCFIQLQDLEICSCNSLIHWPDLQSLVFLRRLKIMQCNGLTGYAEATERRQVLPHLESLKIKECASLVELFNVPASIKEMNLEACPKLESIFGKQQGKSALVEGSCSDAMASTALSEWSSFAGVHFLPCIESLSILMCGNLLGVLDLPPSLKKLKIGHYSNMQVLSCQLDQLQTSVADPSASPMEHVLPPCLESLEIRWCYGLTELLNIPPTLKTLYISGCSNLRVISGYLDALEILDIAFCNSLKSLVSRSGELPSLEQLNLVDCQMLASLPDGPQSCSSLMYLAIEGCPAMKTLPKCLKRQLGSLMYKDLDARHEVMLMKPKTWKYAICGTSEQ